MPHPWPACVALLLLASCADGPPAPVCGLPNVLTVVESDLIARGLRASLLPGPVGEVPQSVQGGVPASVRCAAPVEVTHYDTNRYGGTPQVRLSSVEYTVRAGRNGLFVDAISGVP